MVPKKKKMLTEKQQASYNLTQEIFEKGIDYKKLMNDPEYEKMVDSVTPILIYSESKSLNHYRNLKRGQTI